MFFISMKFSLSALPSAHLLSVDAPEPISDPFERAAGSLLRLVAKH
jgi:hypothetical protein